ncbi:MAG: S1 RNA-binding domain-containing protein [Clostridia bacterium]|nr:S1 RNA-binding domain-containing protein [Clostridia bacterium]
MNTYKPEGKLLASSENREYFMGEAALMRAMAEGKILESIALYCEDRGEGKVLSFNLGKMRGIMPQSEVEYSKTGEEPKDIAVITRVGKAVCFKIIGFRELDGEKVAVLSRKEAQRECMENFLLSLTAGDIIDATVTHLEPFGAFLDIGCGIVSLMSIDCISVSRISHPRDRFYTGMQIKAAIKSIDYATGRIYMTHKELLGTWSENAGAFSVGQTVSGIVRSIESYGIFVELAPNLAGLAEYRDDIYAGGNAAVYIKNIIPEKMKVKLVIVDTFPAPETREKSFDYKIEAGHIDKWVYSPEECARVIETVFE